MKGCVMNVMSRFGWSLLVAAAALPASVLAGPAPYDNAVNKALHPGKASVTATAPRARMRVQPQMAAQPQLAAAPAPATEERRVFSYEPAQPAASAAERRTFTYEPAQSMFVAPARRAAPARHTWENATMKGLGQIR